MPSPTSATALVPFRTPGKTRLAFRSGPDRGLGAGERALLSTAMLTDVIRALEGAVERTLVLAADRGAAATAERLGITWLPDPPGGEGLNRAVDAVTAQLPVDSRALVVVADLPLLRSADVTRLLAVDADVVVAPSRRGGTGGLLLHPPGAVPAAYGDGSAERHRHHAESAGLRVCTRVIGGFHHDVDTVDDLRSIADEDVGQATASVLRALDRAPAG